MAEHIREHRSVLAAAEKRLLIAIARRLPAAINSDHLTALALLAMALFGGDTIRHFTVTLLVGLLSGSYSSVFTAAPLLVLWENREWNNLFHRKRAQPA